MATLRHLRSSLVRPIPARMLVGRGPACVLRLEGRHVSGEHATVLWTGRGWEVRDLGSRNGTFVDGARVEPGRPAPLTAGATLGFGTVDDPWELVDASSPGAMAEDLETGALHVAEGGILALPSADTPQLVIYADARGRWIAEGPDEVTPVDDGAVLTAGSTFRVRLPASVDSTATVDVGPRIDTSTLRFYVSMDEEHVELGVVHRGREIRLERREHWYALLTLARARLADRELPLAEQGWVDRDRLLRMLQLDANALNVAIYRARGQLADAGVEGAASVVEVRRGQRRLGVEPERIVVADASK